MGCTGIKICETDIPTKILLINKTTRLASMAFEMMKFVETFTTSKGKKLKLKIGIHQGDVIAGVIGEQKPQFSLIGDTVNTTSRVCSTGESNEITVSEEAARDLSIYLFSFKKKTVEAKGKGTLNVFQIKKRATNTAARFHKITGLILKKIREERGQLQLKEDLPHSVIKVVNFLNSSNSLSFSRITKTMIIPEVNSLNESSFNESPIKLNSLKNDSPVFPTQVVNEGPSSKTSIKSNSPKHNKEKMMFVNPLKNLLNEDKKIAMKFELVNQVNIHEPKIIKKKVKIDQKSILRTQSKRNKYSQKTILPMKAKIHSEINLKNADDWTFDKRNFYFFNSGGKSKCLEFLKQMVHKHSFLEKILLLTLFFFCVIRNFFLLSLNEFFEINLFFIMEIFFLFILGVTLMFIREFYGKIAKEVFYRNFLLVLFLIGMGACFLEIYSSKIMENFSTSLMTIAILHMILTNIWLILFLFLYFLSC